MNRVASCYQQQDQMHAAQIAQIWRPTKNHLQSTATPKNAASSCIFNPFHPWLCLFGHKWHRIQFYKETNIICVTNIWPALSWSDDDWLEYKRITTSNTPHVNFPYSSQNQFWSHHCHHHHCQKGPLLGHIKIHHMRQILIPENIFWQICYHIFLFVWMPNGLWQLLYEDRSPLPSVDISFA